MNTQVTSMNQLRPGQVITWNWQGVSEKMAADRSIEPIGKIISKRDNPYLSNYLLIQCRDDPDWCIDPEELLAKNREFYIVEE
jgi:hypothetical protein